MLQFDRYWAKESAPSPAGHGKTASPSKIERDPYEALDSLMSVIEALCPEWPARPAFRSAGKFLL